MAGFLYFRPGHTASVTRELIVAWGLGYAFPGPISATTCMGHTPSQSAGTVFGDPQRLGEFGIKMDLDQQVWSKLPGGEVYVGYWKDAKPTPEELARNPQLPGSAVKLADDREWVIPLVRRFDTVQLTTSSNLPTYMECDEHGNWHRGAVVEIHAHLWQVTQPIADSLLAEYVNGQAPTVTDAQIYGALVPLLAANYVVSAGELSLMRATTNEVNTLIAVMAACDWPTFCQWSAELEKKSDSPLPPAGSITSAGGAG